MAPPPTLQVVTANRLADGAVVHLTADGSWSRHLSDAHVARDATAAAALLDVAERAVAARLVVAPYLIEVALEGATLRAVRYRERIRVEGPSIGPAGPIQAPGS